MSTRVFFFCVGAAINESMNARDDGSLVLGALGSRELIDVCLHSLSVLSGKFRANNKATC